MQQAIDYVDHELLTNTFHVTYYGGCAVLFDKETFFPDVEVKSIYLHDTRREVPDKVMEGDQGWVLQGVLSRASFRRRPLSDQKTFTVFFPTHYQYLRQKTGYCEKAHPHILCRDAWRTRGPGCGRFHLDCVTGQE